MTHIERKKENSFDLYTKLRNIPGAQKKITEPTDSCLGFNFYF